MQNLQVNPDSGTRAEVPKKVLIGLLRDMDWMFDQMVPAMREAFGCSFIFLVPGDAAKARYTHLATEGDLFISIDDAHRTTVDADARLELARSFEKKYGLHYFRDILQQNRGLATYYLSYAPHDPRAKNKPAAFEDVVHKVNQEFVYFEKLLDDHQVDLIIKRPDKGCSPCEYVATAMGIPSTFLINTRYESMVGWSFGPFLGEQEIKEIWESLPNANVPDNASETVELPHYAKQIYSKAWTGSPLRQLLKELARSVYEHLDFFFDDLRRGQFFGPKNRLRFIPKITHQIYRFRCKRLLERMCVRDMNKLTEKPFVLYLLQLEPELGTNTMAKEFNNAPAILQQLSLCLPANHNLVIKEINYSIGQRRMKFYEDIARLPNTILCDPSIPGPELLKHAAAVSTLTGTVAFEAARVGKPAIVFSIHNEYNFLPSVQVVESLMHLDLVIEEALRPKSADEIERYKEAGWRYVDAIRQISTDGTGSRWCRGDNDFTPDQLDDLLRLLLQNWKNQKRLRFDDPLDIESIEPKISISATN